MLSLTGRVLQQDLTITRTTRKVQAVPYLITLTWTRAIEACNGCQQQ